jgi:hypothetical protein
MLEQLLGDLGVKFRELEFVEHHRFRRFQFCRRSQVKLSPPAHCLLALLHLALLHLALGLLFALLPLFGPPLRLDCYHYHLHHPLLMKH